ncbi:alcohol oxidase [Exidia glandulosa HHB12029]|uniref:Alcohol oxidase n=1 Tax=Exidia glandulosa HHB12029 TaxID=1314781 RepID=A0A165DN51_EXIGL|nr:alcohol oxidase [Exidia glandulosa HHB12029]
MQHETLEADVIVVGAGTAGCVLAARLAEADPQLRILVLEAGEHTLNGSAIRVPGDFMKLSQPDSTRATHYECEPSDSMVGRKLHIDSARCVGGGSAINYMMYTRGAASDYDDWEQKYENPGWGFDGMLPMFKKFETYEVDPTSPWHGTSGPMHITLRGPLSELSEEWLHTALAFDDRPVVSDPNDFHTFNAYGVWPKYINSAGVRQDAGHLFLYPKVLAPDSNVTLRVESQVARVILQSGRVVGVEFKDQEGLHVAKSNKMVVLSAGAIGTPQILERSGIGSPQVLGAAGIACEVELPGVGENYQDHNVVDSLYLRVRGDDRCAYLRGDPEVVAKAWETYNNGGQGVLSTNREDCGVKLRPSTKELESLGGAFNEEWKRFFEPAPDKPLLFHGILPNPPVDIPDMPDDREHFRAFAYSGYPFSRGSIHIRSGDADIHPRFDSGFFSNLADMGPLIWQYKLCREVARRMPSYRGEMPALHPAFKPGSNVACSTKHLPVAMDAASILYDAEDDAAIEQWVRQNVNSMWHSMGTCAMKPHSAGGVVDPRLNVYGIHGLKIADLSICPSNVSANTASTALAIGEKAACIISDDLGIHVLPA